jgi:hypothetical protein
MRVGDDCGVDVALAVEVQSVEDERHAVIRVQVVEAAARVRARRYGDQLEVRMAPQQARGQSARVAGSARDQHGNRVPLRASGPQV